VHYNRNTHTQWHTRTRAFNGHARNKTRETQTWTDWLSQCQNYAKATSSLTPNSKSDVISAIAYRVATIN